VTAPRAVLALDFASPRASAAVARSGELLATLERERGTSQRLLLPLLDQVLRSAGLEPAAIEGVVALRGPGSFTGLRVACATALGFAQAYGAAATAVALSARESSGVVLAVVDALRDEWFAQRWRRDAGLEAEPLDAPRLVAPAPELFDGVALVLGFGAERLATAGGTAALPVREPRNLATAVARAASNGRWEWDAGRLTRPDYLRPPATTAASAPG
jgi:tRNA threonylcarbamoyladenosine biosynthesis protein TsaB